MPARGWRSGRPEGIVKAVRLTEDIIERIARYVERLQAQLPDDRINEGVALRRLIRIGLDTVEASMHQPQPPQHIPQQSTAAQPPLSLAPAPTAEPQPAPSPVSEPIQSMAPVSTTAAQPVTIQVPYAPPGMQPCLNTRLKHPPYPSSEAECPMCANNRRQREHYARNKEKQVSS
jgi:hypothetical protein